MSQNKSTILCLLFQIFFIIIMESLVIKKKNVSTFLLLIFSFLPSFCLSPSFCVCVGVCAWGGDKACATAHIWKPDEDFMELTLSLYMSVQSGIKLRSPCLLHKHLYMLSHFARPCLKEILILFLFSCEGHKKLLYLYTHWETERKKVNELY